MSRRFQILLTRYARVRAAIDFERQHPRPSLIRLVRLQRLKLMINTHIRRFVEASAVRRASRPRLVPALVSNRTGHVRAV